MSAPQSAETFWSRVRKTDTCWEWIGSKNNSGYGTCAWMRKVYVSHRIAAWLGGLVPTLSAPTAKGERGFVLHKCDNRLCCNPEHLFVGNYSDNQLDAYKKKRRAQPKGDRHANAKLTNVEASEIRKRYATGSCSQDALAKQHKVSQRVISLIVNNRTYTCKQ